MEDKKISDISKLLIGGAKMLSYHCPDCKVPLFEENKKIFCPSCGREAIIEGENNSKREVERKEERESEISKSKDDKTTEKSKKSLKSSEGAFGEYPGDDNLFSEDFNKIESLYKKSILNLSKKLEETDDVKEVKEILDVIDRLVNIHDKLRKMIE